MAAITQIRHSHSDGRAYCDKKLGEGKTHKEALRSLKRRISNAIYRCLQADVRQAAAAACTKGSGGQPGNDSDSGAVGSHPEQPALRTSHSRAQPHDTARHTELVTVITSICSTAPTLPSSSASLASSDGGRRGKGRGRPYGDVRLWAPHRRLVRRGRPAGCLHRFGCAPAWLAGAHGAVRVQGRPADHISVAAAAAALAGAGCGGEHKTSRPRVADVRVSRSGPGFEIYAGMPLACRMANDEIRLPRRSR